MITEECPMPDCPARYGGEDPNYMEMVEFVPRVDDLDNVVGDYNGPDDCLGMIAQIPLCEVPPTATAPLPALPDNPFLKMDDSGLEWVATDYIHVVGRIDLNADSVGADRSLKMEHQLRIGKVWQAPTYMETSAVHLLDVLLTPGEHIGWGNETDRPLVMYGGVGSDESGLGLRVYRMLPEQGNPEGYSGNLMQDANRFGRTIHGEYFRRLMHGAGAEVTLDDLTFRCVTQEHWNRVIDALDLGQYPAVSEVADCDDYAYAMRGLAALEGRTNAIGVVSGARATGHGKKACHMFNAVLLVKAYGGFEVRLLEPNPALGRWIDADYAQRPESIYRRRHD